MVKYREVNPDFWTFGQEGDYVEGVLMKKQSDVGVNKSHLYTLDTKDGLKNVWGATILDQKMDLVEPSTAIKITFLGLTKPEKGKKAAKKFKVEVMEEED